MSLFKQGHLENVIQKYVQTAFTYLPNLWENSVKKLARV